MCALFREKRSSSFVERMLEALRRSPVLRLDGKKTVNLRSVRTPAKTLSLSAEALTAHDGDKPVAFVFGPENGAVNESVANTRGVGRGTGGRAAPLGGAQLDVTPILRRCPPRRTPAGARRHILWVSRGPARLRTAETGGLKPVAVASVSRNIFPNNGGHQQ
jgi:hypothetical protein